MEYERIDGNPQSSNSWASTFSRHCFRKQSHPRNTTMGQGWEPTDVSDTLNVYDIGEIRSPILVVEKWNGMFGLVHNGKPSDN